MMQPKGFKNPLYLVDKSWMCELAKRLYKLKQASNIWNEAIYTYILEMSFTRIDADLYIYVKQQDRHRIALVLYVDDFLVPALSS